MISEEGAATSKELWRMEMVAEMTNFIKLWDRAQELMNLIVAWMLCWLWNKSRLDYILHMFELESLFIYVISIL
jgi:hypothetical protein